MNEAKKGWWRILTFGSGPYTMPPKGITKSEEQTRAILARWSVRVGSDAGMIKSAHSVRVCGPYQTRQEARDGDITRRLGESTTTRKKKSKNTNN